MARRRRAARALLLLSILAHFAGLLGLYALPVHWPSPTYLSENALQPGTFEATLMEGGAKVWADIKALHRASNGSAEWVQTQLGESAVPFPPSCILRQVQGPRV